MIRSRTLATLLSAAALLPPASVLAAALSVSPIRISLSGSARTAAVTLFNGSDGESVVQAQAFLWEQDGGEDRLSETREVLVSPAVFTLGAGNSQLVRLSLRRTPDSERELSYRLILQEVPAVAESQPTGLKVTLRLSLPIFVAPAADAAPELAWHAVCCEDDVLSIEVANHGTRHARVTDFVLHLEDADAPLATHSMAAYVLPGESRRWRVDTTVADPETIFTKRLSLRGHTEDGPVSVEIPVSGQ